MLHLHNQKSVPEIVKKLQIPENNFCVTFKPLTEWKSRFYSNCSYPFTYYFRKVDHFTAGGVCDGIVFERAQLGLKFYLLYRYRNLQFKIAVEDIICVTLVKNRFDNEDFCCMLSLPSYRSSIKISTWCEDNEAKYALNFICRTLLNNPGKAAML